MGCKSHWKKSSINPITNPTPSMATHTLDNICVTTRPLTDEMIAKIEIFNRYTQNRQ
jgi:hypothetical protein